MALHLGRKCFWCEKFFEPARLTRDHLIPVWACRLFWELGPDWKPHNIVKACGSCNAAKGGMPSETYHRVQAISGERKMASLHWHNVQYQCSLGPIDPRMKAYVIGEMKKPIPGHNPPEPPMTELEEAIAREMGIPGAYVVKPHPKVGVPGEPFSKNKPLKRLVYTSGEVPADTVLKWEELNDNLKE